jgi:hypothetical protein
MYILQPQWLAKRGIIERGMEVAIETNLARPGVRFHLRKYDAIWVVSPDRVVIESTNWKTDCGAIIFKVLEALPETPLFAIGNNTTFEGDVAEVRHLTPALRDFPMLECPTDAGSVEQRTFHVGVRKNDHDSVNLQLAFLEDKIGLVCNAHRTLDNRDDPNSAARSAASSFFSDRQEATRLAKHFFGSETEHDIDND